MFIKIGKATHFLHGDTYWKTACGHISELHTDKPRKVDCLNCRKTKAYKKALTRLLK